MKVWVGLWHSKYGTAVQVAKSKDKVVLYFAEMCCDTYWDTIHEHLPLEEARDICAEFVNPKNVGHAERILESWRKRCGPDDSFEFVEREIME